MATLEFSDVVKRIVEQHVSEHVYTSIPAKVISVDNYATNQTIDIQPQIINTFEDNRNIEMGPVLDVPLCMPAGGGGLLSFPVKVGDTVLAIFSQKSIDEWINSNAQDIAYRPADRRTFHFNDAIAIAGLYTKVTNLKPNATDVELKFNNMSIRLGADGNLYVDSDSQINIVSGGNTTINVTGNLVATASSQATVTAPTITLDGNVVVTGNISAGGNVTASGDVEGNEVTATNQNVTLSTHEHSALNTPPTPGT